MITNLLILLAFVAVVLVALKVAQSVFGTGTSKAAATETAARLVAYPTGSAGVLRRRFVRAVTGQHVVMPSGERFAYSELLVRVAPEDLERLDPDGDTDRLGEDAAQLYRTHADRAGWKVPDEVTVVVEVDPALRSGWVPPARGVRSATSERRPLEVGRAATSRPAVGWDAVSDTEGDLDGSAPSVEVPAAEVPAAGRPRAERRAPAAVPPPGPARGAEAPTTTFPALVPDLNGTDGHGMPTVAVTPELRLRVGDEEVQLPRLGTTLLGRLATCPIDLSRPEISMRHAAVRQSAGRWQVMDVGSTNGTTVDGQRIDPHTWVTLQDGTALALAGVPVEVLLGGPGTVAVGNVSTQG